jgi:adenylate cyclase
MRRRFPSSNKAAVPLVSPATIASGLDNTPVALSLLGGFRACRDARTIEIKGRKSQALLAYLALEGLSHPHSRERLCGLLWSESGEARARASLRQVLHELRTTLEGAGCTVLQAGRGGVTLSGNLTTDLTEILDRLASEEVDPRLLDGKASPAALLDGFEDLDPSFRDWLFTARQNLSGLIARNLELLLRSSPSADIRRQAATALLNVDPTHEEACRYGMQDATARGDVGLALKIYKRLWDLLDEEYGTEPSCQTQAIAIQIKTESGLGPGEKRPTLDKGGERPSLAVLPFTSLSAVPDDDYLADGVVEDITTALSRIGWFFVTARNSSFTYKGRSVDVREISRALGVRYVLEGSVRRAGTRLRITAQLIEAVTGHHVWAERYDGSFADVFDYQDRITESVVGALEPRLRGFEISRAERKPTVNLTAYDRVLRSIPLVTAADQGSVVQAQALLSTALEEDPDYAYAMALQARCCALRIHQHWGCDADRQEGARYARQAIVAGRDDPRALAEAAIALGYLDRDHSTAHEAMKRSLGLHPCCADTHNKAGWLHVYMEEPARAISHFETAMRLSPIDLAMCHFLTGYASALLLAGECEGARIHAERALALNGSWASAHRIRIIALVKLGRLQEARVAAAALLKVAPGFRVSDHAGRSPFKTDALWREWIDCLRCAGLPD